MDEIAGATGEADTTIEFLCDVIQTIETDRLHVAWNMRGDGRTSERFGGAARPRIRRVIRIDILDQLAADFFQHGVDPDRRRNVMKEIDQRGDRDECQRVGHDQRKVGNERRQLERSAVSAGRDRPVMPDRAHHVHAIDEGGNEHRQADLVAAIFHEIVEQARPIGAAGIGDSRNRDRKHGGGDRQHRSGHQQQNIGGAIGPGQVDP